MNYKEYPPHCNFPDSEWENFHKNHIPTWKIVLQEIQNKENNVGIEIGSYCGGSAVWCLENIINKNSGHLYCIDINQNEYLTNNLRPYSNVTFKKGDSFDILRSLTHNDQSNEFADFIYVDGSHIAKNVLEDLVLSWRLLKQNGILIIDDYLWGYDRTDVEKPKPSVDAFMYIYAGLYIPLQIAWQVFLRKKPYTLVEDYLQQKYQTA